MTFVSCSHWGMFPTDPGKLERVAEAICPLVKPWLDDKSIEPHPCRGCTETVFHGEVGTPLCKLEMREIARAAIRAYERYDGRQHVIDWGLV